MMMEINGSRPLSLINEIIKWMNKWINKKTLTEVIKKHKFIILC